MKLAFSTASCPAWDFETIVARAKEYGYDGVDIRGHLERKQLTQADIFLADPKTLAACFASAGIAIACLSASIVMTGSKANDAKQADDARALMDRATELGCSVVKIPDTMVRAGQNPAAVARAFGEWLLSLGDYAAGRGLTIAVENLHSFRCAREMWSVLDTVAHPAIASSWNVLSARLAGESPLVSVPTLNSRIAFAQVQDAKISATGLAYCPLGTGDVAVEQFVSRLRGVGYGGWVSYEYDKGAAAGFPEPQDVLPGALLQMRKWTREYVKPAPKAAAKSIQKPVTV